MVKSAEYGDGLDGTLDLRRTPHRLPPAESLVRACLVVEAHVLGDEASEVLFADDQDVVEQLATQSAREPFRERIHVGLVDRGAHDARAGRSGNAGEAGAGLRIVITDEYLRCTPCIVALRACCAHHVAENVASVAS